MPGREWGLLERWRKLFWFIALGGSFRGTPPHERQPQALLPAFGQPGPLPGTSPEASCFLRRRKLRYLVHKCNIAEAGTRPMSSFLPTEQRLTVTRRRHPAFPRGPAV